MNTIFTTDKNGKKRYLDIRVEEINGVWCIVKATGQVGGKEATSVTEVPLGLRCDEACEDHVEECEHQGDGHSSYVGE